VGRPVGLKYAEGYRVITLGEPDVHD
jgi:hypothetical protein